MDTKKPGSRRWTGTGSFYINRSGSVVAAAAAPATVVVAVVGEYKDQDNEEDPIVIVAETHGSYLLSLSSYGGEGKWFRIIWGKL